MRSLPLISIVGPTATGKSAFGLWLAGQAIERKVYQGVDLISADSRQVYQGLELLSGADIPEGWFRQGESFVHPTQPISLWGVSRLNPASDWSLAHFQQWAWQVFQSSWRENRLPLVIGGTGLYHAHLLNPQLSQQPGPNPQLRQTLENASLSQLQDYSLERDPLGWEKLTESDRQNPRRLIRLLERQEASNLNPYPKNVLKAEHLTVYLDAPLPYIEQQIAARVAYRLELGVIEEVSRFFALLPDKDKPAMTATGIKEIELFLRGEINDKTLRERWITRERQYAKRQQTWWKKHTPDFEANVLNPGWKEETAEKIFGWLK